MLNLENGKYEIDGEDIFVSVQDYNTKPESEGKFEAHKQYADIQFIIKGEEKLGYTNIKNCKPTTFYDDKNDIVFLDGKGDFIKAVEGTAKAMSSMLKTAFKRNVFSMIGYLFSKKGIEEMKQKMDYKNVGGALLMGVNGVVLKAHGSSDVQSFLSALENGYKLVSVDIVNKFKEELNK